MAVYHLVGYVVRDVLKVEKAFLLRDLGLHDDLHQHVAELFAQVGHILLFDSRNGLVGLLDHRPDKALVRLDPVPGTAVRRAQVFDQFYESFRGLAVGRRGGHDVFVHITHRFL